MGIISLAAIIRIPINQSGFHGMSTGFGSRCSNGKLIPSTKTNHQTYWPDIPDLLVDILRGFPKNGLPIFWGGKDSNKPANVAGNFGGGFALKSSA